MDLSSLEGNSINDGIEESLCTLSYMSVDDIAQAVLEKGRWALMGKVDIHSTYKILPVHLEDRWLLGMSWE